MAGRLMPPRNPCSVAKTVLVTGASGQDGSFLAEHLLAAGHRVLALDRAREGTAPNLAEAARHPKFGYLEGDLRDAAFVTRAIKEHAPDELYNLAAQSFVPKSWEDPVDTAEVNALGPLRLLEAIRRHSPKTRFLQASSAEVFGKVTRSPQDELTPQNPTSPYGATKCFAMNATRSYREGLGVFACNAILFNHESERRSLHFVTRKVTHAVAQIHRGRKEPLRMGNLDAKRDWGYAPDYVRAMQAILAGDAPDDYVVATGKAHSIREFIGLAFQEVGITVRWEGQGLHEKGLDESGRVLVEVDPAFFRPTEASVLVGDATRIHQRLGWKPSVDLRGLVHRMVAHDLALIDSGRPLENARP